MRLSGAVGENKRGKGEDEERSEMTCNKHAQNDEISTSVYLRGRKWSKI